MSKKLIMDDGDLVESLEKKLKKQKKAIKKARVLLAESGRLLRMLDSGSQALCDSIDKFLTENA